MVNPNVIILHQAVVANILNAIIIMGISIINVVLVKAHVVFLAL
ncbi:hypothetical protein BB14905_16465 [Bacillus sp. B14905]|nr:hypothetical protein BB14905_16465 [Bacillus sp. B14905]